jgi:hypothetical protein
MQNFRYNCISPEDGLVRRKHVVTTIIQRIKEIVALGGVYSESRHTPNRMQTPRLKSDRHCSMIGSNVA